jgi:hypothetical protein
MKRCELIKPIKTALLTFNLPIVSVERVQVCAICTVLFVFLCTCVFVSLYVCL